MAASSLLFITLVTGFSEQAEADGRTAVQARQMESLNRGLVAVKTGNGVFVSWRLLGTESASVSFNVYRNGKKLNGSPITSSTNYQDAGGDSNAVYQVRAVLNGVEQAPSETAGVWNKPYKSVPLQNGRGKNA